MQSFTAVCWHFTSAFPDIGKKSPNCLKKHLFSAIFKLTNPSGYYESPTSTNWICSSVIRHLFLLLNSRMFWSLSLVLFETTLPKKNNTTFCDRFWDIYFWSLCRTFVKSHYFSIFWPLWNAFFKTFFLQFSSMIIRFGSMLSKMWNISYIIHF